MRRRLALFVFSALVFHSGAFAQKEKKAKPAPTGEAIIWQDPGDIRSKNLFYGAGGQEHMPKLPVKFLSEEAGGISPKFEVKDADGEKWKAKLALEAQPETVASRLLWAVGYFANENYYYPDLQVKDVPRLKRGQEFQSPDDHIANVRLQRHPLGKKKGNWNWKHNPFYGTREYNGLRVMMALVRNWDLTDDNNAIFEDDSGKTIYEVTDVGATFGMTGKSYTDRMAKNNLSKYKKGKFVKKVTPDYVDFNFPTHPPLIFIFTPKFFFSETSMRWVGKRIPREDAKWIGGLLAQLSAEQIRDAFRAAGYSPQQVEEYARTVEKRIAELNKL